MNNDTTLNSAQLSKIHDLIMTAFLPLEIFIDMAGSSCAGGEGFDLTDFADVVRPLFKHAERVIDDRLNEMAK